MTSSPAAVVVLISGRGTNLQAILDQTAAHQLPIEIRAVISNNPNALGLERARNARLPTHIVDHRAFASRADFDSALMQVTDNYRPQLVILAGFMRILGKEFIRHYQGRLINIHPSLLPEFPGLNTHARALRSGAVRHGASVHFVTDVVDRGPVILQAVVPVKPGDTVQTLAERVLKEEHRIYPLAIRWLAEGRVKLHDGRIFLDGKYQAEPIREN
ncbi:MAG TPA: phosphoribosylglycinamide formyltransferase [Acidiferrobacterales bacterium]|nr:phosphoribosylglycinamide formyltransferase [Acidiferrobacterales bacterium]